MGVMVDSGTNVTASFPAAQQVVVSSTDDSIALGDTSGNLVKVSPKNGLVTDSNDYAVQIDVVSSSVTYVGKAVIATATSAASWQVKKISVSGTVTSITWAGGANSFNQIWDNRASLSYS